MMVGLGKFGNETDDEILLVVAIRDFFMSLNHSAK